MIHQRFSILVFPQIIILLLSFVLCTSCSEESANSDADFVTENTLFLESSLERDPEFLQYWYRGVAEVCSYKLEQARYGEMREGNAVLIFVSETFDKDALTKRDDGKGNSAPILKCNFSKNFITGIYPYSMMMSVYTPVDLLKNPYTLKVSTGSQEWCGHTYTQLDLEKDKYHFTEHSYFPGEGDQDLMLEPAFLEDELWTRLRIDPTSVPSGKMKMIPGTFASRLKHFPIGAVEVNVTKEADAGFSGDGIAISSVKVNYTEPNRTLTIYYQTEFPHLITAWEESYISGWGDAAKEMTTKSTLIKKKLLDYWSKNKNKDLKLREELGLD